jgi:hypothetical protein
MIANAGLVVRPIVGVFFLVAGLMLWRRSRAGGVLISIGAVLFIGAELYGLFVLKPFVGRPFDEAWHQQIATVDAVATLGLLVSSLGLFAHAFKMRST